MFYHKIIFYKKHIFTKPPFPPHNKDHNDQKNQKPHA